MKMQTSNYIHRQAFSSATQKYSPVEHVWFDIYHNFASEIDSILCEQINYNLISGIYDNDKQTANLSSINRSAFQFI
jgi:hypothetical protein